MEGFEARLAKVELAIVDGEERFDEVGRNMEEFREEVLTAINRVLAQCQDQRNSMEESHRAEVSSLREELNGVLLKLERTEEELTLCKKALAHDIPSTSEVRTTPSRVEVPRPKSFKGSRNAKELDNFLWSM